MKKAEIFYPVTAISYLTAVDFAAKLVILRHYESRTRSTDKYVNVNLLMESAAVSTCQEAGGASMETAWDKIDMSGI